MAIFLFDLQRFDEKTVSSWSDLTNEISNASGDTTIKFSGNISASAGNLSNNSGANITIDLNEKQLTLAANITIVSGTNITFKNGKFNGVVGIRTITNNGNLTINNVTLSDYRAFIVTSESGITYLTGTNTLSLTTSPGTYKFGEFEFSLTVSGNANTTPLTITTTDSTLDMEAYSKNTKVEVTVNGVTYTSPATTGKKGIKFCYDEENGFNIQFNDATTFTATKDGTTIEYTWDGNTIKAKRSTDSAANQKTWSEIDTKVYNNTPIPVAKLNFEEYFSDEYNLQGETELIIPNVKCTDSSIGNWLVYSSVNNVGAYYGKIYRTATTENWKVEWVSGQAGKLTGIVVANNLSAYIAKEFATNAIPIKIAKNATTDETTGTTTTTDPTATFTSTDAENAFTVNSENSTVSGSTALTLTSGTLNLKTATQTITAGNYKVSGYSGGNDGIGITYDTSTSSTTVTDIDNGEKFTVEFSGTATNYYKSTFGLTALENGTISKIYVGEFTEGSTESATVGVVLGNLKDNMMGFVTPTDKTLTVNATENSIVLNQAITGTETTNVNKIAKLTVDSGVYTLAVYDGDSSSSSNFSSAVSTIALTAQTTIDSALGLNKKITASDSSFTVTSLTTDATNFTVNVSATPSVTNAAAITLNSGSISATANQTIDGIGKTLTVTVGDIVVTKTTSGFTATGSTGEAFSIGTTTYTISAGTDVALTYNGTNTTTSIELTAGKGITIATSSASNTFTAVTGTITITNDNTVTGIDNGEVFTIGEYTYSKTATGFVRYKTSDSSDPKIWTSTVSTESVSLSSLTNDTNWTALVLADGGAISIDDKSEACVFVDNLTAPTKIYGKLSSTSNLTLEKYSESDATPTSIAVDNQAVTVSTDFGEVPVTLSNEATVKYDSKKITGNVAKVVLGTMTFTPEVGNEFSLGSTDYVMEKAGLTKGDSEYIWATEATDYTLPGETNWSRIYLLDSGDTTLDMSKDSDPKTAIIVDSGITKRLANLTYTEGSNTYAFEKIASSPIGTIKLPNGTLNFTTDFKTTVETSKGVYTVNDNEYTGSGLTIAADTKSSTLTAGTVTIAAGKSVTADVKLAVTAGEISATAVDGAWTTLTGLTDGDTFTVDGSTTYQVYGSKNLVTLDDGELEKLYDGTTEISGGSLAFSALTDSNFKKIVQLDSAGVLDLTEVIDANSIVVKNGDPATKVGNLTYSTGAYNLTTRSDGTTSALTGIELGTSAATLTTAIVTTVNTTGNTEYKINGQSFDAKTNLTIVTPTSTAYLTEGTITLAAGKSVTTRRTDSINHDEKISTTSGTMTVTAAGSNNVVTIGALEAGTAFTVDSGKFTMTNVGLALADKTKFNPNVTTEITTADLTGDDFKTVLPAKDGVIEIKSTTATNVVLADLTDVTNSKLYGTLTKKSGTYILDGATAMTQVTVTGTKVTLPAVNQAPTTTIITEAATFTVEATKAFTVDATKFLTITDADEINLTSGSVSANIPVNAGGYQITAGDDSDVTVNYDGSSVTVSDINSGESFTVDDVTYTRTSAGLYDATNKQIVTTGFSGSTLTLDDVGIENVIAPDGTTLDLTAQKKDALVYDSITTPKTKLATLTVGSKIELKGESTASAKIKTVNIPARSTVTVDFATKVSAPAGSVTVNDVDFEATTAVILDSDGSTATLNTGTVALDSSTPTISTASDTITATNGEFTVTASSGKFTTLNDLDSGDSFTYGGKTYTQTDVGLMTGSTLATALVGTTVDVTKISTAKWYNLVALTDGVLDLSKATADSLVVDSVTSPTTKLGTLTVSGTDYTVDFATKVSAPAGTFTLNKVKYTGTSALTLDATATTSTLNTGTVTVDGTVNAMDDTISGTGFSATATNGKFTALTNLDAGDSFTYGGTTYTQSALGLVTGSTIATSLAGTSIDPTKISSAKWEKFIAPTNGVLDLTNATTSVVLDSTTTPTVKLGNLTVDGTNFTVDYATKVKTNSGTVTVNGATFTGTTDLILDATTSTATLNTGTVTATNATVTATDDSITVNNGTINATAKDGKFTALANLATGDSFTYGGTTYTQTALGLTTDSMIRQDLTSSTLDLSKLDGTGESYLIIDGTLELPQEIEGSVLLISDDFTKIYGELSSTDDGFSLTRPSTVNETLTSITISGTTAELAADFASVPLTVGNTKISSLTLKNKNKTFTVDATTEIPSINSNVTAITLTEGSIAIENQTVTVGENVIVDVVGTIVITEDEVTGISVGDVFTLNGKTYKLVNEDVGLMNTTDSKIVTSGFDTDTVTIADMEETPAVAPTSGVLDLTKVTEDSIVLDSISNPTTILGNVTADENDFTVDYETKVKVARGTVTVNGETFNGTTDLTLDSDGSTATLNTGTITLEDGETGTATDDEITVESGTMNATAKDGKFTTLAGLNTNESFTYNGKTYTQTDVGLMTDETICQDLTSSTLDLSKLDGAWENYLIIDGTLELPQDIESSVLLISDDFTKNFGTLTNSDGKYTLTAGKDALDSIEISGTAVDVYKALATVPITAGEATFTATTSGKYFTVDATGNYPSIDGASSVQLDSGTITAKTGTHKINDKTFTVADADSVNIDSTLTVSAIPEGGAITVDGKTYTAPENNSTLTYTEDDGWFFDGYVPEVYNVTVDRSGNVSVDTGIKLSDIVSSGKQVSGGELELVSVEVPVKLTTAIALTVTGGGEELAEILSSTGSVTFTEDEITAEGNVRLNPTGGAKVNGVSVTGDNNYTVTVTGGTVTALTEIGAGVTVTGLQNATIQTNAEGSVTVDKTFTANSGVTYTVTNGKVSAVTGVTSITGDFSNKVTINGTAYNIRGGEVTVNSDGTIEAGEGSYYINGHMFATTAATTFTTSKGTVIGATLDGDGELTVYQNETNFKVNDDTLTLSGNKTVVLSVEGGKVTEAIGVTGTISGLGDATVYDIAKATVNGTAINITDADALVEDGKVTQLVDVPGGSKITTAPSMTVTSAENGSFTFGNSVYVIHDTVDGSVDFLTDQNTQVTNIENFAGSISGSVGEVTLNGSAFAGNNPNVTVTSDGDIITGVYGLADGSSVGGDIDAATFILPRGTVTINGDTYATDGGNDIELTGNTITGLEYGATVTVGSAGEYNINGETVVAHAGNAYSTNRDGVFLIETNHLPITDQTPKESIPADVTLVESDSTVKTGDGVDSVIVRNYSNATIDVAEGNPTLIAVSGSVTLENYDDNVAIQTFEYTDVDGALMRGDIKFADGKMTLGDAVVTFDEAAQYEGGTFAELMNSRGDKSKVGFTHTAGGVVDVGNSSDNYFLKGNYAANSSDTQKSGSSTLTGGTGNDTLLMGAGDVANGGAGDNQIYITDPSLRNVTDEGATIVLTQGKNTVHNFNDGFTAASDKIQVRNVDNLDYGFGSSGLTLTSGNAELTFDDAETEKIILSDGSTDYTAQFAPDDEELMVDEAVDLFFGNENGINFSEYDGTVSVNLNNSAASLDGSAARMYGIDKVTAGAGNATLTGAWGTDNTLAAGTGKVDMYSGAGDDMLVGYTGSDKTGSATFHYTSGYGNDTITNFDFMAGESDSLSDEIYVDTSRNVLTDIHLDGSDVVIGFNGSSNDNLTIADAKGKHIMFSGVVSIVDDELTYDGYSDCYVGGSDNSTLTVGNGFGLVDIVLGSEEDGIQYLGRITVLDASGADGTTAMVGNDLNNLLIGGKGENSIWGGDGTNDTLVGGSGKNTFFFNMDGGQDVIRNAHDGDVVELYGVNLDNIGSADIEGGGVSIELLDGSKVTVESTAAVEYKLADGSTYTANHETGDWERKE